MTIFLIIVIVILIGLLIQQYRYRRRMTRGALDVQTTLLDQIGNLTDALVQSRKNYKALEEGQQEIVDNYENDFLTFQEQIDAAKNSAAYDREKREEAERLLALKDKIIEKHAGSCETILAEVVNEMMAELRPADE